MMFYIYKITNVHAAFQNVLNGKKPTQGTAVLEVAIKFDTRFL